MTKRDDRIRRTVFRLVSGTPHTDDPRQRLSRKGILASVMSHFLGGAQRVKTIPMEGFSASNVDIGWLKDRIRDTWHESSLNVEDFAEALDWGLTYMVQRVKKLEINQVELSQEQALLEIDMTTKDDFGYYGYHFNVKLD
jgi:hypothetical protein